VRRTPLRLAPLLLALVASRGSATEIPVITHGDQVRLEDHLVQGKYVLFDFYADWCGPCRALAPTLEALAAQNPDKLAVRKVDIVNGDSAVSRQYQIRFVPYLKLYGPDGQLLREGDAGGVLGALSSALGGAPLGAGGGGGSSGGGPGALPLLVLLAVVGVVAFLFLARGRGRSAPAPVTPQRPASPAGDPAMPRVWFVQLQGALEGPFTAADLEGMVRRGQLSREAEVRRRGDAAWRRLRDVVDER
jgi:thioredoxin 1